MLSYSNCVLFSQGESVDDGDTDGRLEMSWLTSFGVHVEKGSSEFFWIVSSLGYMPVFSARDRGRV